ncbi:MAG: amidohydrolase family protein [Halioglobus sp.]
MTQWYKLACVFLTGVFLLTSLIARADGAGSRIVINNVNIFDGKREKLIPDRSVLIEGNRIARIGGSALAPDDATVIDGGGRTLTPGFIDAHVHLQWNVGPYEFVDSPPDYHAALALVEARNTLMRGFTSVRDTGGAVFGIKKAIDQGFHPGPRIYASGAAIGMTSGHGDYRTVNELPRQLGGPAETPLERLGISVFADGVPEVLTASRDQMRRGAHFLKMFVGGAVSGLRDPLDVAEYSFEEVKASANEAKRWNTYLAVHAYTDRSIREALEAGAMSIEHANLVTEDTMKLAAQKGAFMSVQTGFFLAPAPDSFSLAQKKRQRLAADGLDNMMQLAKKYKVKLLFGTDFVGSLETKKLQLDEFSNRTRWFSPAEILIQATSGNAEILAMSGPRNPYPGRLGVIEEGAYADILLIDGNPLEDISILAEPEENLALIMKDGKIVKNTVE